MKDKLSPDKSARAKHLTSHQFQPGVSGNPHGRPPKPKPAKQSQNAGQAEHLKPYRFAPGVSGNPGGQPKHKPAEVKPARPACPPERAEHLKAHQFRPGVSGNPHGRPKKRPTTPVENCAEYQLLPCSNDPPEQAIAESADNIE